MARPYNHESRVRAERGTGPHLFHGHGTLVFATRLGETALLTPAIQAYADRLWSRPAYQAVMASDHNRDALSEIEHEPPQHHVPRSRRHLPSLRLG